MGAAVGDLTDLATARYACNISTPTTTNDPILQAYITAISAYVPGVLNRNLLSASYTEYYQGNGKDRMLLRQRPVTAISAINWQGQVLTAGDPIAGTSGYYIENGLAVRLVNFVFPKDSVIQISYTAGYTTVPADISLAVAELVAEAYARRTHVGETSRAQGGQVTVSFDTKKMHAAIADKLRNYMHGAPC